jgi:AcrR family transcriptional regulator
MFRTRGIDGTTLAAVAKAAGAALGSLTHLVGGKRALARAVLDQVLEQLAADARMALSAGQTVEDEIRALTKTCAAWPVEHGRLIGVLEAYIAPESSGGGARVPERLGAVLGDWAKRRGPAEVVPLMPSQLYAVILAPLMSPMPAYDRVELAKERRLDRWLETLTAAALAAISPAKPIERPAESVTRRKTKPPASRPSSQRSFFDEQDR